MTKTEKLNCCNWSGAAAQGRIYKLITETTTGCVEIPEGDEESSIQTEGALTKRIQITKGSSPLTASAENLCSGREDGIETYEVVTGKRL